MGFANWVDPFLLVFDHKYLSVAQGDKAHFLKNCLEHASFVLGTEISYFVI